MRCPNCHGEIDDNLVTCSMCGFILNYDKLNINRDLDKTQRILFLSKQNLLFIIKLLVLLFIVAFTSYTVFLEIITSNFEEDFKALIIPILVIILVITLIIVVIKGKRKW